MFVLDFVTVNPTKAVVNCGINHLKETYENVQGFITAKKSSYINEKNEYDTPGFCCKN